MKYLYKNRIIVVMLALMLGLVGCNTPLKNNGQQNLINAYFYNGQNGNLEAQEAKITLDSNVTNEEKMKAVIDILAKGPQVGNQAAKPIDFHIEDVALKEQVAYVTFDKEYTSLTTENQVAIRVSLVYSLTDLDFIEAVEFYVEDKPLTTNYGTKVGAVSRKDMLINVPIPNPPTLTQTITLYFPKANEDKLYKEERTISINTNTPIEEYIIKELIKGPTIEGLLPVLPPDTKVNAIKTQELNCQLDLAYNLKNAQTTSLLQEKLVIYSLVNSLTENPKVQKVMFLMDGQKQSEFTSVTDAAGLIERNEEIIADTP
ncbi:MAG: GerMN domain-containing protein [Cellulosilyticaceae bacterium]